ncbi:NUDIX domain-containing protein [Microbacterium enclense]|uniref:NUDIX hydrolase n=1 Tax=Microbacterium enclense TaxID=993073 RepID=UPI0036DC2C29
MTDPEAPVGAGAGRDATGPALGASAAVGLDGAVRAPEVHVSAAVVLDAAGRALVVRKRGTSMFMQPGGKPEAGEDAATACAREVREEIGLEVALDALRPLGVFRAAAANEPGWIVVAHAFALSAEATDVEARAEIAETRWITRDDLAILPLAPLSRDLLLPAAFDRHG